MLRKFVKGRSGHEILGLRDTITVVKGCVSVILKPGVRTAPTFDTTRVTPVLVKIWFTVYTIKTEYDQVNYEILQNRGTSGLYFLQSSLRKRY